MYIPARAGSRQSRFYTPESNSKTKNLSFPARVPSPLLCRSCLSPPSWGVYLTACPAGQETPSHPKMLLPRWLHYPFEFLLLVYHFRTHGRQEEAGVPS